MELTFAQASGDSFIISGNHTLWNSCHILRIQGNDVPSFTYRGQQKTGHDQILYSPIKLVVNLSTQLKSDIN
jgi:hypothetical protein